MSAVKFKVKKNLTPPLIKLQEAIPVYVKITSKMFLGKEMKATTDGKKKEPAMLCDCVNLDTGEESQIILSAVVKSVFTESYPGDAYVGKGFELTKHPKMLGKEYNRYTVKELELDEAVTPASESTVTKKK